MQKYLILDYETRSECDLKKKGAIEYAKHPTTEILCVSFRFGTKKELAAAPVRNWSPFLSKNPPNAFTNALDFPEVILVARNAGFEQAITTYTLQKYFDIPSIPISRWRCTAAMASALALPKNLEGSCLALNLPIQKDMEGRRLILKYCKPRKATKNNRSKWHNKLSDLKRIIQYCETDVKADTAFFLKARPLIESEQRLWELDQEINQRGVTIDTDLVDTTLDLINEETEKLTNEVQKLSRGEIQSATQRDRILKFVNNDGWDLPDLRAKTVSDALKTIACSPSHSRRMLEIRQSIGKTSTAKYLAFKERVGTDSKIRENLVFHAATTGRWAGSGVQLQNFPRGSIKNKTASGDSRSFDMKLLVETIKSGDLELIRTLYKNPMNAFASALRGVIVPEKGKELFCADYAAIEARVLFWLANHEAGLQAFRENRDLYKEMAAFIYRKAIDKISSTERFVGKGVILGCGYSMGAKKFQESCKLQGIEISDDDAQMAVTAYRTKHAPVVKLWANIERAAIAAVKNPGKTFAINHTRWFTQDDFLWCELPSKRRLAYYKPCVRMKKTSWGEDKLMLHHYGADRYTRKWGLQSTYGGKLVENVDQAISRDLMAAAMFRIEDAGFEIVTSVHDELLGEYEIGKKESKEFSNLMAELPAWAAGLPVKTEGWKDERYHK